MLPSVATSTEQRTAAGKSCASGVLVSLALVAGCGQSLSPPRVVESNSDLIVTGQSTVSRRLSLPADTPIEVRVWAESVDMRAELGSDAGSDSVRANAPNDRLGVITFYRPAGPAQDVELRVIGEDHARSRGAVSVLVQALPATSEADRARVAAVRLEAEACAAFSDVERGADAAAKFAAAAALRKRIGDTRGSGIDLLHEADARMVRGYEYRRSSELAAQAAKLLQQSNEPEYAIRATRVEGAALQALAGTLSGDARHRAYLAARERLTDAAARASAADMPFEAAYALNYRGVTYHYEGQARHAQADYERALELFRAAKNAPGQSLSVDSLALLHHEQGEFRAAVTRFDEALGLISAAESPATYAHTLHNSALPLRSLGRFEEAISRYQQAGGLLRAAGDRDGEARALQGIATVLRYAGEPERARTLYQEAIRVRERAGGSRELFLALVALADIEREAGRYQEARALLTRASAARAVQPTRWRACTWDSQRWSSRSATWRLPENSYSKRSLSSCRRHTRIECGRCSRLRTSRRSRARSGPQPMRTPGYSRLPAGAARS